MQSSEIANLLLPFLREDNKRVVYVGGDTKVLLVCKQVDFPYSLANSQQGHISLTECALIKPNDFERIALLVSQDYTMNSTKGALTEEVRKVVNRISKERTFNVRLSGGLEVVIYE